MRCFETTPSDVLSKSRQQTSQIAMFASFTKKAIKELAKCAPIEVNNNPKPSGRFVRVVHIDI
jgi:hypothetical protein